MASTVITLLLMTIILALSHATYLDLDSDSRLVHANLSSMISTLRC